MRLNYYEFPENTPEDVLLAHGCDVVLKAGTTIHVEYIPDDKRALVQYVDARIGGLTVTAVKRLMKQYGGVGWTEHINRDGCVFETTPITLNGNNSKFKYNQHL